MISGDTIAAISSSVAPAARIIVRVSGPGAIEFAQKFSHSDLPSAGGVFHIELSFADLSVPAWLYLFRAPHSYTGEDLVEFHIPGNTVLGKMLLDHLLRAGSRHADPGEFTARAYFNGRIDLTEAEGVAATIHAGNEQEMAAARQLMAGELSKRLAPILDLVAETLALVEVGIDFTDEDVSFLTPGQISQRIAQADGSLEKLLQESVRFETLAHEPRIVLVGRPNAGKSTLLNALAGRERAVVSPIAGTTRDALSAEVPLRRGMARLIDVAGIDEQPGSTESQVSSEQRRIEHLMCQHALREMEQADHVILVRDVTHKRPDPALPRTPDRIVMTKSDLSDESTIGQNGLLVVSAKTGAGLDALCKQLDVLAFGSSGSAATLALNARHILAIHNARAALGRAAIQAGALPEVLAMELREVLDALGQILGRVTPDDLLGRVFSQFCIGK